MAYKKLFAVDGNFEKYFGLLGSYNTPEHKDFAKNLFNNQFGIKRPLDDLSMRLVTYNFKRRMVFRVFFDDDNNVIEIETQFGRSNDFVPGDFKSGMENDCQEIFNFPQSLVADDEAPSASASSNDMAHSTSKNNKKVGVKILSLFSSVFKDGTINPTADNTYGLSFPGEHDENSTFGL